MYSARMERRVRTTVECRAVVQELRSTTPEFWFRTEALVFVERGDLIWIESDSLVVEHPDGRTTRHPGTNVEPSGGRLAPLVCARQQRCQ